MWRRAISLATRRSAQTIERASRLPQPLLHERVNGAYSFMETLRHLLFAWDSWLTRMVLRVPNAYHEWGVAPEARPEDVVDLEPVLGVRAERFGRVRDHLTLPDVETPAPAPSRRQQRLPWATIKNDNKEEQPCNRTRSPRC